MSDATWTIGRKITPVWVRLPKAGQQCPYTGLSRAKIYQLIAGASPLVRSVVVPNGSSRGSRGTRLINLDSLLNYIENL